MILLRRQENIDIVAVTIERAIVAVAIARPKRDAKRQPRMWQHRIPGLNELRHTERVTADDDRLRQRRKLQRHS